MKVGREKQEGGHSQNAWEGGSTTGGKGLTGRS